MTRGDRLLLVLALVMGPGLIDMTRAGHGLINTFAGIPWLPSPGLTPGDLGWGLERAYEAWALARLADPGARVARRLCAARERLAEGVALLAAGRAKPARQAFRAYTDLLAELAGTTADVQDVRVRGQLARHLLEHRYILATEHLDLPAGMRDALAAPIVAAASAYDAVRALLPARLRDSLFFAEEEARWAWEMAQASAAQGL